VHRCEIGGLVHDIGKVALPESVLAKPGPLSGPEWAAVRTHSEIGEALAREGSFFAGVADIVRHHHERLDGTGYPDGLRGAEIPIEARIVAACDAYAAMTAERPYQASRTQDEAVAELRRSAGTHLDPDVVAALIEVLDARREAAARYFARSAAA
jgi:HD-GYP domain-containing protein (c-di-GMP phosphodiesterase class II)